MTLCLSFVLSLLLKTGFEARGVDLGKCQRGVLGSRFYEQKKLTHTRFSNLRLVSYTDKEEKNMKEREWTQETVEAGEFGCSHQNFRCWGLVGLGRLVRPRSSRATCNVPQLFSLSSYYELKTAIIR